MNENGLQNQYKNKSFKQGESLILALGTAC